MIPDKIIVTAKGEFKPGLAIRLKFAMSQKNDFSYTLFLNDEGIAEIFKSELLRFFDESRKLFIMDYSEPRKFLTGHIEAHVLSKDEIEKSISAYDTFESVNFPQNYLENLKKALVVNPESNCVVSLEKITSPDAEQASFFEERSFQASKNHPAAFAYQAAKGSWASSIIVFFLLVFSSTGAKVIFELIALLLILAGLSLGIIALFDIRKHGVKGILAPALVGIIINGLLLFIFTNNFLAARAAHSG